jgi:hypothetical protein
MTENIQNQEFLREIQSDLQLTKLRAAGKRYGVPALIVLVMALLAGGGWSLWQRQQSARLTDAGLRYEAALEAQKKGDTAAALASLRALAKTGDGGYATLAALHIAAGQQDDVGLLNTIAGDPQQDALVRDIAAVLAGYRATKPMPGAVRERLERLGGATGPWQYLAREALALNALASGLTAEARPMLIALRDDPTLPAPTASRIAALLATLPAETPASQQEKK